MNDKNAGNPTITANRLLNIFPLRRFFKAVTHWKEMAILKKE